MNIKSLNYIVCSLIVGIIVSCSGGGNNTTKSSEKDITEFSIEGTAGVISGTNISITMAYGTSVTSLIPTIKISDKASVSPASGVAQDFTSPVTYTVTAEDGSTKVYIATVTDALSDAKDITAFSLEGETAIIVGTNIYVSVANGTVVTSLTPALLTHTGTSISPLATASQDFTSQVTYTVTAADSSTKTYTVTVKVGKAGDKATFTADGVSFKVAYVPDAYVSGGITFPTGTDDLGPSATVTDAYWVGETQVTYQLWNEVHIWATANGYTFANGGAQGGAGPLSPAFNGGGAVGTDQHPVTNVSWRDALVWANALTEWYNAMNSTSYTVVYKNGGGTPLRTADGTCDTVTPNPSATGFRLLTANEWEMAARYIGTAAPTTPTLSTEVLTTSVGGVTYYWTPGDYASGATADCTNAGATQAVSVYDYSAPPSSFSTNTLAVKSKAANSLQVYDMSGNVWEWQFDDTTPGIKGIRGGSWSNTIDNMEVGHVGDGSPWDKSRDIGFRIARSAL